MNRSIVRWLPHIGLVLAMVGCDQHDASEDTGDIDRQGQAVEADELEEHGSESVSEPALFPSIGYGQDMVRDDTLPPSRIPDEYVRTEEKVTLPSWPEERAAKESAKIEDAELANVEQAPVPTASPSVIARQERFLSKVRERQGEFDELDPEAYDEMKRKELGE